MTLFKKIRNSPILKSPVARFLILVLGIIVLWYISYNIMFVGLMLGGVLTFCFRILLLPPDILNSPVYITAGNYLGFNGVWILSLALLAIFPPSRHILKNIGKGMKGNNLKILLVGLGIGLAGNLVCGFAAILNGDIRLHFDSLQIFALLVLLAVVFLQAGAEELLCRVFIHYNILALGGKPLLAVIINCSFFSYMHTGSYGITPLALVNLFLLGLLCSAMVVYLDSFWGAIGVHTAWNYSQAVLLGLPNSGVVAPFSVFRLDSATATESFANSVKFGPEGTVVATVVLILSTVLVWLWHRKHASAKAE